MCTILSGERVEPLLKMCPDFKLEQIFTNCNSSGFHGGFIGPNSTRSSRSGVQVTSMVGKLRNGATLNTFGRCFIAQAHDILNNIPEDIKPRGVKEGWMKVIKEGQRFLRGEQKQNDKTKKETNKTKHTKSEIHSNKLVNESNGMV